MVVAAGVVAMPVTPVAVAAAAHGAVPPVMHKGKAAASPAHTVRVHRKDRVHVVPVMPILNAERRGSKAGAAAAATATPPSNVVPTMP